jgi:hypothetical protein
MRFAETTTLSWTNTVAYMTAERVNVGGVLKFPLGYPNPITIPMKMQNVPNPSTNWFMKDADWMNTRITPWSAYLPRSPVHGKRRVHRYFDGHIDFSVGIQLASP